MKADTEKMSKSAKENARYQLRTDNGHILLGRPCISESNMEGFRLFDTEHRSSKPLCLAYKAAQLVAPDKADAFLTTLRHATVHDCRPTTHEEEILCVVRKVGIEEAAFARYFHDGTAEAALEQDSYLVQYDLKNSIKSRQPSARLAVSSHSSRV